MPSFSRTLDNTLGQLVCDALRPAPPGQFPQLGDGYQNWYRRNCNREPDPAPPPFNGGQCPGVQYDVFVDFREERNDGEVRTGTGFLRVFGAISSITLNDSCSSQFPNQVEVRARDASGNPFTYRNTLGAFGCQTTPGTNFYQTSFTITGTTIVRTNGAPDTCGSPPPPPIPFPVQPPDTSVTYNDNDNNSISIDIGDISIGFPIEVNGDFRFPISLNINNPAINIPVDVNVDFGFEIGGDGEPIPVSRPRPPGQPRPPESDGREPEDYSTEDDVDVDDENPIDDEEPPEDDECPETRPRPPVQSQVIRAVVVTVFNPGSDASVIFGAADSDGVPIYAPAAGYVQFRIAVNSLQTAWTNDIPVKNGRCFVPVPWEGGAIDFGFVPRSPDTVAVITPVFGANEATRPRTGATPSCD